MLRHRDIEVEYTMGITPGIPALVYSDGSSVQESFTEAEITTNQTALGTLVSVPLRRSVDTGGERFGVLPAAARRRFGAVRGIPYGGCVRKVQRTRLGLRSARRRGGASS